MSYSLNFTKVFSSWRVAEPSDGMHGVSGVVDGDAMQQRFSRARKEQLNGWIGVDLDGTLAYYDGWKGARHIGKPIPAMAKRVRAWLAQGLEVRIFTARACELEQVRHVQAWCERYFGVRLAVTNAKDFDMLELWDDRCVQVQPNTGQIVSRFS